MTEKERRPRTRRRRVDDRTNCDEYLSVFVSGYQLVLPLCRYRLHVLSAVEIHLELDFPSFMTSHGTGPALRRPILSSPVASQPALQLGAPFPFISRNESARNPQT